MMVQILSETSILCHKRFLNIFFNGYSSIDVNFKKTSSIRLLVSAIYYHNVITNAYVINIMCIIYK